jgi:hypothetical protein
MLNYDIHDVADFIRGLYATQDYPNPALYMAPYGYTISVVALAAAGSTTATLNITGNADFLLTDIFYRPSVAAAAQTVSTKTASFIRMLIVDAGTNEQFTASAVDLENYASNGNAGNRGLPFPRLIQGRTALAFTFTNWSAAEASTFDVFLSGIQIKKMNSGMRVGP